MNPILRRLILGAIAKEALWMLLLKTSKLYFWAGINVMKKKIGDDELYDLPEEELLMLREEEQDDRAR